MYLFPIFVIAEKHIHLDSDIMIKNYDVNKTISNKM